MVEKAVYNLQVVYECPNIQNLYDLDAYFLAYYPITLL